MTARTLAGATSAQPVVASRPMVAVASVLGALAMVVLNAAIVHVALPTIGESLQVAPARTVSLVSAYQLGLVMMLLPAAALGEGLGLRGVFVAGTILFTATSVLCAISTSMTWLVAARFLQGLGASAVLALGVALLRSIVSADRLGAAIGWNALTVALASAAAPTLGAMILSFAPWPWLFALNLPIGLGVLIAARHLPRVAGTGRLPDWTSVALNLGTFAFLFTGAEQLITRPALAVPCVACAALQAGLLIRREAKRPMSLFPLDLLRRPSLRVSVVASIACFTGQTAALVALPFQLRHGFGLSPFMTGLLLTPWPFTVALVAPTAGRWAERVPSAHLCLIGGALLATGLGTAAWRPSAGQPTGLIPCLMLCGLGFGLFNVPNNRNLFLSVPAERSGAAGGLQAMARLTGQTAGALVMMLLFTVAPLEEAVRAGLSLGAVLALAAGSSSLLRSTMLDSTRT